MGLGINGAFEVGTQLRGLDLEKSILDAMADMEKGKRGSPMEWRTNVYRRWSGTSFIAEIDRIEAQIRAFNAVPLPAPVRVFLTAYLETLAKVEPATTVCSDCDAIIPCADTYQSVRDQRLICEACFEQAEAAGRARIREGPLD